MSIGRTARAAGNAGVYIGTVTRVTGAECYVEVPRLAAGFEYGPARYPANLNATGPAAATSSAGDHGHGSAGDHAHSYTDNTGVGSTGGATSTAGGHAHGSAGEHTHTLEGLAAGNRLEPGDEVAVAFLEGGRDELVVLVRLA